MTSYAYSSMFPLKRELQARVHVPLWRGNFRPMCSGKNSESQAGTVVECSFDLRWSQMKAKAVSIHWVESKYLWRLTCESYAIVRSSHLCQVSLREISLAEGNERYCPSPHVHCYPEALASYPMKSPLTSSSCEFLNHVTIQPLRFQHHWIAISSVNYRIPQKTKNDKLVIANKFCIKVMFSYRHHI